MEQAFSFAADLLAAVGFTAAAILFAFRGQNTLQKTLFTLALAITGAWAFVLSISHSGHPVWDHLPPTFSALRDAGWFAAILALLHHGSAGQSLWRYLSVAAGVLCV